MKALVWDGSGLCLYAKRLNRQKFVGPRVTLNEVAAVVSRTIEVALNIRLDRLHTVFQTALAWTDTHLWEMTFGNTGFGIPDPAYGPDGPLDARKTTLPEALEGMRGKTFWYLYDFGDAWDHTVRIESIAPACASSSYPRLREASGMRPPEDSGGPRDRPKRWRPLASPGRNIMSKLSKSSARATIRIPNPKPA